MAEEQISVKISELAETNNFNDDDELPLVQDGTTKKIKRTIVVESIKADLGSAALAESADFEPAGAIQAVENQLNQNTSQQNERIDRIEYSIYLIQKNGVFKAYRTKSLMLADVAIIPVNSIVSVVNDPANNAQTNDINGEYHYNGTDFFKLPNNILNLLNIKTAAAEANAKSYADLKKAEAIQTAAFDAQIKADDAEKASNNFVKEIISVPDMLLKAEYYTSFFVNVVDSILNNAAGYNNVLTVIIAVQPNKTYSIKNFNVSNTDAFSIHESSTKSNVAGFAVSKANYFFAKNGSGAVKTSANTNYLYINISFLEYSNKDFSLTSADDVVVFGSEVLAASNIKTEKVGGLGKNIATDFEFGIGKVVNLNADNVFDFTPFTLASLRVESGKKYRFHCDNYLSTAFVIAFRTDDSTESGAVFFRKTVDQIVFNSDGSFDFIVPDGMNHFLFNIHYSGDGEPFDILNSVSINEYLDGAKNVASLLGLPLIDIHARQLLASTVKKTDLNTTTQEGLSNNLVNIENITVGKVILIDNDSIVNFSAYSLLSTQVESGKKYRFYADIYVQNGFVYAFRPDSSVEEGTVYGRKTADELVLNSDGSFDFIVPDGMNHFLFNIRYTGSFNSFDITNSALLQQYDVDVEQVTAISNIAIADLKARQKIKELESGASNLSPLNAKRWLAIGDSITDYSFRPYPTYKNFTQQLAEKYNMEVYNYGQSGTGFYGRYDSINQITESESDVDLITVFMGTNDWGNIQVVPNNKPLGIFGDTGTATISGCMNTFFMNLISKFPSIPIYIFTPLPRHDNWGVTAQKNQQGYTLAELVVLLKQYANNYSLRVLDLYYESNFRCQTTAMKDIWTVGGDGVHPNGEAHAKLVQLIENFLKNSGG